MAGMISEAFVRVRPDTRGFKQDVQRQTRSAFAGVGKLIGVSLGAGLGVTVGRELGRSVAAAKEAQVIQAQLARAVEATGESWDQQAAAIDAALQAQSKLSAFDDEELARSLTTLTRLIGNTTDALKVNAVAADVARATGRPLESVSRALGRAYLGQTAGLTRLGVALDKGVKGYQAISVVQERYAGAAAAFAGTAEGAQARLNKALDDSREIIGGALLPVITDLSGRVADYLQKANETGQLQERVNDVMEDATAVVGGLRDGFDKVRAVIGPLVEGVGGLGNAVQIALGVKLLSSLGRGVTGFAALATASGITSRKVVADAAAMEVALDAATRPRTVPVSVVAGGGGGGGKTAPKGGTGVPILGGFGPLGTAILVGTGALYVRGLVKQSQSSDDAKIIAAWNEMTPAEQREALRQDSGWRFFYEQMEGRLHLRLKPLPRSRGLITRPDEGTRGAGATGLAAPQEKPDTGVTKGMSRLQKLRLDLAAAARRDDKQAQQRIQTEIVAIFQNRVDTTRLTGQALVRFKNELSAELDKLDSINDSIDADEQAAADDARQRGQDRRTRQAARDQAFVDSLARGRDPIERKLQRALDTADPRDDVKLLVAYQKRIQAEIEVVASAVRDAGVKADTLEFLNGLLKDVNDRILGARRSRDEILGAERLTFAEGAIELGKLKDLPVSQIGKLYDRAIAAARANVGKAKTQSRSSSVASRARHQGRGSRQQAARPRSN